MFMSDNELYCLTGYRHKSYQAKWLRERGWVFEVTHTGHPRVGYKYFLERMSSERQRKEPTAEPNFEALT